MTLNLESIYDLPISVSQSVLDWDIRSMYYQFTSPVLNSTPTPIAIKMGKGRKGKPHWRHLRALRCDLAWQNQWTKIYELFSQYKLDNNITQFWDDTILAEWLTPQLTNARVVFDCQYKGCIAVDFADEDARILFYLRWS